jgi:hypothetical protein
MEPDKKESVRLQAFMDQLGKGISAQKKEFDKCLEGSEDKIANKPERAKEMMEAIDAIKAVMKMPLKHRLEILIALIQEYGGVIDNDAIFNMILGITASVGAYCDELPPELKKILRIQ